MKIWIITTEYPPAFGGGIGTYVENVAKMYSQNGDSVKVILRDSINERKNENSNLEVCRFVLKYGEKYSFMGEIQSMAYQYFEYINNLLIEEKPDIIEIQEYNAIGYYILQRKYIDKDYLKDIPVVIHLHTPQFALFSINKSINYKLPDYWVGEMEKFCIKAADALMCPSEFLAENLKDINKNIPIKVINLPFYLKEENEENQVDSKLFVYFGRTEYRKGVEQLVKAFDNLWKKGYNCKLKIIGGDVNFFPKNEPLGEMLQNKYKNRVDSGVLEFQGNTPQDLLIKEIKKARAVVIPSLYENFPNTCIMSMWLKKPVIVSRQGGQAEMVYEDGKNGYIFDHSISGDLENKIIQVLNDDENRLKELGNNAYIRINELCNLEKNLSLRKEFFKEVIKNYKYKNEYPFLNDTSNYKINIDYKNKGLLSVVLPYYNMGEYLDECVDSIKKSTYKNKEIIIVNDGSTDIKSIEALQKYKKDSNVKIINIENKGLANARNIGAEHSNGEFIAFLDPDDMVENTFYTKAIDILNKFKNVSYVFSWVKYFEGSNGCWTTFDSQLPYLLCHNMLNANTLIRKSDFISYGKNKIEMEFGMEDYDMWISLAENNCFGVCIPEFLSFYRVRKNSMAREFNANNLLYSTELITNNHKQLYLKYGNEVFNILQANGPSYRYANPSFYIDSVDTKVVFNNPKLKDKLWKYRIYRIFIRFLQKIGIIKLIKRFKHKLR